MHINKINDKKYIGMTCNKESRFGKNGSGYLRKTKGKFNQPYFANAILKYGWENFETIILEDHLTKKQADEREKFFIQKYETQNNKKGYNIKDGGSNGKLSEETKKKISEHMIGRFAKEKNPFWGKKHTEEVKKIIGQKNKINHRDISGEKNPMYHKIFTEEERQKISKRKKGTHLSEETKLKISQANKEYYKTHIHHNTGKKFTLERKQKIREKMLGRVMTEDQKKKIGMSHAPYFYKCVETQEIFNTSVEASKKMNIDKTSIQRAANGKQKQAGGFHWERIKKPLK